MPHHVELPDGRKITSGTVISYDGVYTEEPRLFRITIRDGYYEAEAIGKWAEQGRRENVAFDSEREFVDWCMGPEPPENVDVPRTLVETVLQRIPLC